MEQLIIILVIGVISFVNWLIRQSAEARERKKQQERLERGEESMPAEEELLEPQLRRSTPSPVEDDPSESMRKLMEALGLPMENEPPKPVPRPAPAIPPAQPTPSYRAPEPPRRESLGDPYAQKTDRPAQPAFRPREEYREIELPRSLESEPAPTTLLHDWSKKVRPVEQVIAAEHRQVRRLLASPHGLREAIVLSEVLGKPKALRD